MFDLRCSLAAALFALTVGGTSAIAQSAPRTGPLPALDIERLQLNPGSDGSLLVPSGRLSEVGRTRFSLLGEYVNQPAVTRLSSGSQGARLLNRAEAIATVSRALDRWVQLELQFPVIVYQDEMQALVDRGLAPVASNGLGAPLVGIRVAALRQGGSMPLSLSAGAMITLPLGSAAALAFEAQPRFVPSLSLGRDFGVVEIGGEVYWRFRSRRDAATNELGLAVEANRKLTDALRVEAGAIVDLALRDGGATIQTFAGARYAARPDLELFLGGGPAFGTLVGTPRYRLMGGAAMTLDDPIPRVSPLKKAPGVAVSPARVSQRSVLAVLPVENLTSGPAPIKELRAAVETAMGARFKVVPSDILEDFLVQHRVRYTGGIDAEVAHAAREELGADVVLITTLQEYRQDFPPILALGMRLVSTGEEPEILWTGMEARTGDQSPGLLRLGEIKQLGKLQELELSRLVRSLDAFLAGGGMTTAACERDVKYGPRVRFRSPQLDEAQGRTVAVLPFLNRSRRRFAGDAVALEFVRQLVATGRYRVLEPGVVRDYLLRARVMIPGGVSVETARVLRGALGADLLVSGVVLDYLDRAGPEGPTIRFTATVLEGGSGDVLWQSTSFNRGDDGVFFFGLGTVATPGDLTCRMVGAVTDQVRGTVPVEASAALASARRLPGPSQEPTSRLPASTCEAPLPAGAIELAPETLRPEREARRAVAVRFDPESGAMIAADREAFLALVRCAAGRGYHLLVRAIGSPSSDQMAVAARRGVELLSLAVGEKLPVERVEVEILSRAEPGDGVELVVAVIPGPRRGAPQAAIAATKPKPDRETRVETDPPKERAGQTSDQARPKAKADGPGSVATGNQQGPSVASLIPREEAPRASKVRLEEAEQAQEQLRPGEAGRRQIAKAIEADRADLRRCVEGHLKRSPEALRSQGTLRLSVDGRGRVAATHLTDVKLNGTYLESCIKEAAKAWRFPANGEDFELQIPLTFVGREGTGDP